MKRLSNLFVIVAFVALLLTVGVCPPLFAIGFSDNFSEGVIDSSLWVTHGYYGGIGGVGAGSWQYSISEGTPGAPLGYLQARVWGPTSGNTFGAEARVRTTYNFNDGSSWLVNFSWATNIVDTHDADFVVGLTDGNDPDDCHFDWLVNDTSHPGTSKLWRNSLNGFAGPTWQPDSPSPPFSTQNWSVVINPAGTAYLYQSPNAQGAIYRQVALNPSNPWYLGFYVNSATSWGFPAEDDNFRLYGVSATPPLWASAVSGNWSDSSKWVAGVPNNVGAAAVLTAPTSSALTITLDSCETVGALQFGNSGNTSLGYTLSGNGSNTLTFNNSGGGATITVVNGTHVINAPVVLADNLVVSGNGKLTFGNASSIAETGSRCSLTKSGGGLLTLAGYNTYSGGTTINGGVLQFASTPAVPVTGIVTINAGGALAAAGAYNTVTA
ncbi:MAG: autotransporter-associated beta strand repeat-containing protein [Thermoguttaceae bacterium]|jgi:autotransporter-associated beta strand protein